MITGRRDTIGSTEDPTSSHDAPSQDAHVDDPGSPEAKAALTSSPTMNLTLDEGKARAQAAKAAPQKRDAEGAATKDLTVPDSPFRKSALPKGYHNLFYSSSDEAEEEGAVTEPQEISMSSRSSIKLLNCKALLCLPRRCIPMDTTRRMWGLDLPCSYSTSMPHVVSTMGPLCVAPMSVPWFNTSRSSSATLKPLAYGIPLKEFTSHRKKPGDRGGLFPVWGYPWVQPEDTTTQTQAEDLFWRWVSLKNFTV
ncbi:LOW QUALITY PROTEIN: ATP-binding cassette (ABC) Superfamily [Phytophthora palmivora]|uniref:ATP-binding cassette (ABC) Superfamily n=1 Tax=Phytophthora palmivora TaxID=4796 RepID=A0A2P4XMP7_9STRA|nr:LOW QUALITY PROTEIN: ATP-binding cassette (ABC) Superfamily [Phytophthora palmivora]